MKKDRMTQKEWNQAQMLEALGNVNRWYFQQKYGREAQNDEELVVYYIQSGGAKAFAERNEAEAPNRGGQDERKHENRSSDSQPTPQEEIPQAQTPEEAKKLLEDVEFLATITAEEIREVCRRCREKEKK